MGELALSLRGRKAQALTIAYAGDIGESDLALLATERGIQAKPIQQIRERHHALARALASGLSPAEASAITGYDPARISVLKSDPSVKELIAHYTAVRDGAFADFQERAAQVSIDYLNILSETAEERPEEVTPAFALEVVTKLAGPAGVAAPAKSVIVAATVDITERLQRGRARAEAAIIEGRKPVSEAIRAAVKP